MSTSLEMQKDNLETDYEPPELESVLSPEKLEREVLYAGTVSHHGGDHDANPDVLSIRPF